MTPAEVMALQDELNRTANARLDKDGKFGLKTRIVQTFRALSLPWGESQRIDQSGAYHGLLQNSMLRLTAANGKMAIAWAGKADIDNDGPRNPDHDSDHQNYTSLHWVEGGPCDSYTFFGFVLPRSIMQQFGIRLGDYGYIGRGGLYVYASFYDRGPEGKLGEISVAAARAIKVPSSPTSGGVSMKDILEDGEEPVSYIAFPGSGPGVAVLRAQQEAGAHLAANGMTA